VTHTLKLCFKLFGALTASAARIAFAFFECRGVADVDILEIFPPVGKLFQ
jgi:hypothetical protein